MTAITNGGAAVFGEAAAVNNAGLVTGTANGRAFLFNGATLESEFTLITPVAGQRAVDINEAGPIVGQFNGPPVPGNSWTTLGSPLRATGINSCDVLESART